jgi:non-specific serine/threonine protein kinase
VDSEPFELEEIVHLLSRLEEKSLITIAAQGEIKRYGMLQMVREYAAEHLPDLAGDELGLRHLEYFLGVAEEGEANLVGPRQSEWLDRLDAEQDNMRTALDYTKHNAEAGESGLRLAGCLARYWHTRGYLSEGRRHLQAIMALAK